MHVKIYPAALLTFALAGCGPQAESPNMTALDACKRADVKDKVLDQIATAFVTKSGNLIAMFGGPEAFKAASEDFKSRASIENPRVSDSPLADQKVYEVHCTIDLATVNSAKDNTPVEFRNVEYTIHYANGTTDLGTDNYTLIPNQASFFQAVYINGIPRDQYVAQQQASAALPSASAESPEVPTAMPEASPTSSPDDGSQDSVRAAAEAADSASQAAAKRITDGN